MIKKIFFVFCLVTTFLSGCNLTQSNIPTFTEVSLLNSESKKIEKTDNHYVLKIQEEFTFEISIRNPEQYVIHSLMINGEKYANYMFEKGSDFETIYIKSVAPETKGKFTFSISSIKYYSEKKINDAKIEGNSNIELYVEYYTLKLISSNSQMGTVSGDGDYPSGATVTLNATPFENYSFSGWFSDENYNTLTSKNPTLVFKMPASNVILYAKFNLKKVVFWSSFGSAYSNVLNSVVDKITAETGIAIEHETQGSYDEINRNMISAIALGYYPNIAMGYPDHFATYLSSGILKPLNDYLSEEDINDYYTEYMNENYFYDDGGENAQKKIYALPFNKSTELLGYNGVFVDYCATQNAELANIPATWDEWEVKGPLYNDIFTGLMGKKVYGVQDVEGKASSFEVLAANAAAPAGKELLLDMSKVDPKTSVLMSWDATDNAFITLTRQWRAEYTNLPDSEKTKQAKKRVGQVMFNSSENQPKVIEMLKHFNRLNKAKIFGTPASLGGSYSSDAFAQCKVMFMICSSGGLSYNTADWHHRFRVAPIPYKYADTKQVISLGVNICLTDKGDFDKSVKIIKALTTSKYQTEWCLETGYYPCSKSALTSTEYQAFLNEDKTLSAADAYSEPTRVAYREGSKINSVYYMNQPEEGQAKVYPTADLEWNKFVDPAFKGSSEIRAVIKGVLASVFSIEDVNDTAAYKAKLAELENAPTLKGQSTIQFVH